MSTAAAPEVNGFADSPPSLGKGIRSLPRFVPALYLETGALNPDAIRSFRRLHRMTQREFAEFMGVSESTVGNWERGEHEPDEAHVSLLHSFFEGTLKIMAESDGIVPPARSFKRYLAEGATDALYDRDVDLQRISQLTAQVDQLTAENWALRGVIDRSSAAIIEQATNAQKRVRQGMV